MNDLVLLLLAVSVFSMGYGLWIGYRDLNPGRPAEVVVSAVPDEELLIFDRVTSGLSVLPRVNDLRTMEAARAGVMAKVGEEYGLGSTEVEKIYWRVWRSTHGPRR